MINFLFLIILLLVTLIVYLYVQFRLQKKEFQYRIKALQDEIVEISKKQNGQLQQLQLSQELQERLRINNAFLTRSIFEFSYELVEILFKNNSLN